MAWSPVKMAQRSNEQSIAVVLEIRRVLQYVLGVSSVVAYILEVFEFLAMPSNVFLAITGSSSRT
jgi:hypothetical protein